MGSHQVSTCYLGLGVGPGFQPHPAPEGLHPIAFPLFIALLTLPSPQLLSFGCTKSTDLRILNQNKPIQTLSSCNFHPPMLSLLLPFIAILSETLTYTYYFIYLPIVIPCLSPLIGFLFCKICTHCLMSWQSIPQSIIFLLPIQCDRPVFPILISSAGHMASKGLYLFYCEFPWILDLGRIPPQPHCLTALLLRCISLPSFYCFSSFIFHEAFQMTLRTFVQRAFITFFKILKYRKVQRITSHMHISTIQNQ